MPEIHVTDEQGTEHIFPDGSTPDMIAKVLNVKAPTATAAPQAQPQQPGMLDPRGGWSPGDVLRGAVSGVKNMVMHPIDTGAAMAQPFVASGMAPGGMYPTTAATGRPQDSQANAQVQQQAQQDQAQQAASIKQNPAYAIGSAVGPAVVTAGLTKGVPMLADLAEGGAGGIRSYLRPTSSPAIVSRTEFAARKLSAAVLPATKDASNFIRAAQSELPNVLDYAKRTSNPLSTQLEFSKAAAGYAQEIGQVKDQILGPVKDQVVKTTGTGYGSRMQEGPDTYATLGDIDARVVNLNKQLDAPALNADDARRALATKTELQAEVKGLTNILRQNLSQTSGIPVEQIADLWQRVPRAFELAHDTDAAVTQRMQGVGQADMKPIKTSELPSRALNFVRGSQVNVADRAFQRAISNFPGEIKPTPAPTPMPSAPADRMMDLLQQSKQRRLDSLLRP